MTLNSRTFLKFQRPVSFAYFLAKHPALEASFHFNEYVRQSRQKAMSSGFLEVSRCLQIRLWTSEEDVAPPYPNVETADTHQQDETAVNEGERNQNGVCLAGPDMFGSAA